MASAAGQSLTLGNGRRVGFLVRGPQDGVPVVYVHGWPGCRLESLLMRDEALTRHGVRIIAVDRPGYGDTQPLTGARAERMADVLDVCDHLGIEEFSVIGSSCGGGNGVALAASAPTRVKRLVLMSGQMPHDDLSALAGMDPGQLEELTAATAGRTRAGGGGAGVAPDAVDRGRYGTDRRRGIQHPRDAVGEATVGRTGS